MGYAGLFIAVYSKELILPVRFELGTPIIVHRVESLMDEKRASIFRVTDFPIYPEIRNNFENRQHFM
jgi:hypothetical protein